MRSKETIAQELEAKRGRLAAYRERELLMLSPDGIKSYGIGSRNIQRYDTSLNEVRTMISKLECEVAELEAELNGSAPRKAFSIVPRDW